MEFQYEMDSDYALKVLSQTKLFQKLIRINKAAQDKRQFEVGSLLREHHIENFLVAYFHSFVSYILAMQVGANLFVGNMDPEVDEKKLYDTFSTFGTILTTKIMRDPETGESRGFGFVSYDSFTSSDAALLQMNGQFLCNRPVHVSYAFKKDTKGEKHGSTAERLIAANRPQEGPQPMVPMPVPMVPAAIPMMPPLPGMAMPPAPPPAPMGVSVLPPTVPPIPMMPMIPPMPPVPRM